VNQVTTTLSTTRALATAAALILALGATSCGERVDLGRSPSRLVISTLSGASSAKPEDLGGSLLSDVITKVERADADGGDFFTTYNDLGEVTMRVVLRDQGQPGALTSPSLLNQVTITRYHVDFIRTDGRNAQGVDVPYSFDSGVTLTVGESDGKVGFEMVHHTAKLEAPLKALGGNGQFINAIANVTFYGRDQAGNEIQASGSIGIVFGNFADPQ
jgi:hypothetical protein